MKDFIHRRTQVFSLLDDRDKQIGAQGGPDLDSNAVGRSAEGSHKGPGLVGCTQSPQPEIHAEIKSYTSEDCSIPTLAHISSFFSVVKYK